MIDIIFHWITIILTGSIYSAKLDLSLTEKTMSKSNIDPAIEQETMSRNELEQYFTAVQERFDSLEEKYDSKFNIVDQRLNKIEQRLDNIETRLNRIESAVFMILEIVKGNDVKWSELDRRVFKLEKRAV